MQDIPRLIIITGGVMSGLGKGVLSASLGHILRSKNYRIVPIKIDPYFNYDAGTLNPYEHGEVFVTDDGGEIDLDFGHYERFTGITTKKKWNITSGNIYKAVIDKERRGDFLGKTVQLIPHVTNEIKGRIFKIWEEERPDFLLIELGGTIGDIEGRVFVEALRQLKKDVNCCYIHLTYVPIITGEQKTKPTQRSVEILRSYGISPNFIVCRCREFLQEKTKEKISLFCDVEKERVISAPDVDVIYKVPLNLQKEGFGEKIESFFGLEQRKCRLELEEYIEKVEKSRVEKTIAIAGKYTSFSDAYISVVEAVKHAGAELGIKPKIKWICTDEFDDEGREEELERILKGVDAVIVPGGFGKRGTEGKIKIIKYCRENNVPFLGLCLGFQLAVIEFARNVCNLRDANSTEFDPKTEHPVIDLMEEQKRIMQLGGTMRLGAQKAVLKEDSLVHKLYGKKIVWERHRHRYEVNPKYIEILEKNGLVFSGKSEDGLLMEFLELPGHKFFVATQANPEFKSKPNKPAPLFLGLMKSCI